MAKPEGAFKVVCENRKARFNYEILETFEAGLVLTGPEIKSVRSGHVKLDQSYVRPEQDEMYLLQARIEPYRFDTQQALDASRKRKLLLKKGEIKKLSIAVERKGLTIIPLRMYLKRGFAKLEIALARGKDVGDKRQSIKKREADREAQRAMKRRSD